MQERSEGLQEKTGHAEKPDKKKEISNRARRAQTGGGPPPEPLKDWEQKIIDHMSESVLMGIEDGCDTFQENTEKVKDCGVGPNGDASCKGLQSMTMCSRLVGYNIDTSSVPSGSNSAAVSTLQSQMQEDNGDTDQDSDDNIQAPPPSKKMHAGVLMKRQSISMKRKRKEPPSTGESLLEIEKQKLALQREQLELKKEKWRNEAEQRERAVKALEEISVSLRFNSLPSDVSVSPFFSLK